MLLAWTASERKGLLEAPGGQSCGFILAANPPRHSLHRTGTGSAGSLVTSSLFCWPDCWKSSGKEKHDLAVMPWTQNMSVVPLSVSVKRGNYSDLCQGTSSFQDRVPHFLLTKGWDLCVFKCKLLSPGAVSVVSAHKATQTPSSPEGLWIHTLNISSYQLQHSPPPSCPIFSYSYPSLFNNSSICLSTEGSGSGLKIKSH